MTVTKNEEKQFFPATFAPNILHNVPFETVNILPRLVAVCLTFVLFGIFSTP